METLVFILQKCYVLLIILWLVGLVVKTIKYLRVQRFKLTSYLFSFIRWYGRPYFVANTNQHRKNYMRFSNLLNIYTVLIVLGTMLLYFTKNMPFL